MVRAMRTPSSSSSTTRLLALPRVTRGCILTDVDRLNFDALLNVSRRWVVRDLVLEDLGLAERVHKRRASRARRSYRSTHRKSEKVPFKRL